MQTTYSAEFLNANLTELREKAFLRVVILMGIAAYALVTWALWPTVRSAPARLLGGLLGCILVLTCTFSYWLSHRNLRAASLLLLSGLVACISGAFLILQSADVLYFYILPITFAGILPNRRSGIVIALIAVGISSLATAFGLMGELFPVSLLALILMAGANLIVVSNLYTALTWALLGYDSARRNQDIARERKGELEQTLRSLSIATNTLYRANEALEFARREADEARKLKQNFAQMISHELRTPLNLIVGFTEVMVKSPEIYGSALPPRYLRDLVVVYRNASHLQSLVNDVLDLARIDAAQMSLQIEKTNLVGIIDDVVSAARGLVEMQQLEFRAEIEQGLPTVWVDPIRLRQIIYNLLNNAARYTPSGYVELRVRNWPEQSGWMEFAVTDTGIGIAADQLQRIFEPFHQVAGPEQKRRGGVGLGLTISQDLARMHGGQIQVESTLGVGSTFYFRFPCHPPALEQARRDSDLPISREIAYRDRVVLLITRSVSAASMVSRRLQGCRTVVVSDLKQAESLVHQIIPQVVLLDTLDLELDNDAIRTQIADWGLSDVYFIMCPLPGEELLRKQFGVYGYLIKPVTQLTLLDMLRPLGDAVYNILVVDDDQSFTQLIERMLENRLSQYRVLRAHTGNEALEIASQHRPDLVLLDLDLPDLDGSQVLERMRANPRLASIGVIIVSGNDLDWSVGLAGKMTVIRSPSMTSTDVMNWIAALVEVQSR